MVALDAAALAPFPRFSRFNSPYPAHDAGRAVDLYPGGSRAPSPVAGRVTRTKTVACPSRPYAADHDHLIVIDTGDHLARILHVDPGVEPGDRVARGDPLGDLVRSGYFAPWVDDHVHLGFRPPDRDPVRATGSVPLPVDVPIAAVEWDGTGTVVATGDTYAILDAPEHPAPGSTYAGIAADDGAHVLDGGLAHYEWGGRLAAGERPSRDRSGASTPVRFLGETIGTTDGESIHWAGIDVLANGEPIVGLSLYLGREALSAKLVERDHDFAVGEDVTVAIAP
ncbi:MAG: hypothetical protein ABEJ77_03290 [Halanaeroarchaeum sp.]